MKEFRNKTTAELNQELADRRQELREFRFAMAGSKTRDVKEGRQLRTDIARILTVLNERQAAGQSN